MLQRDLELFEFDLQLRRQEGRQFFQALREIPVVVQRIDQQRDQSAVALGQIGERQLRQQVYPQRRRVRGDLLVLAVLGVIAIGGGGRVVEHAEIDVLAIRGSGVG